ncbi:hypothetical protein SCP_1600970 [Sparassis crispa]|uniref:Uncharacterized protein n=1 Tax=Sparassis crispa TaxID=139825 RepID=A0A401H4R7_9APHY|nr:hypothetical protein SCP_1600970 [Sparassis crispa]GBE89435.1 hypothetical protein SCP_1600970 [Sparassis crispa]
MSGRPSPTRRRRRIGITDSTIGRRSGHLTQFAAHADTIATSLNDARSHLEQCLTLLRGQASSTRSLSSVEDHPAFQAYNRLQKELTLALHECERGRKCLFDMVSPTSIVNDVKVHGDEQEGLRSTIDLGHKDLDNATQHVLFAPSSKRLPPPEIKQVFRANIGVRTPVTRERPKRSHERMREAKARVVAQEPKNMNCEAGEKWHQMSRLERSSLPLESEQFMGLQPQAFYIPRTYQPLTLEEAPTS